MKPVPGKCPLCAEEALSIQEKLVYVPGSLSGSTRKIPCRGGVFLVCGACGGQAEGTVEPGGAHALFDIREMVTG